MIPEKGRLIKNIFSYDKSSHNTREENSRIITKAQQMRTNCRRSLKKKKNCRRPYKRKNEPRNENNFLLLKNSSCQQLQLISWKLHQLEKEHYFAIKRGWFKIPQKAAKVLTVLIFFKRILINPTFWSSISYVALRMMLQPIQAILYVRKKPSHVAIKILQMINVEEILRAFMRLSNISRYRNLKLYLKRAQVIKPLVCT